MAGSASAAGFPCRRASAEYARASWPACALPPGGVPTEMVSLNFEEVKFDYKEQSADGSLGGETKQGYDFVFVDAQGHVEQNVAVAIVAVDPIDFEKRAHAAAMPPR